MILFLYLFLGMAESLNIFSLNCNGLSPKLNRIVTLFYEKSIDILFLQETFKINQKIFDKIRNTHPNLNLIYNHQGKPNQGGMGYLKKSDIEVEFLKCNSKYENKNFQKFKIRKNDLTVEILNIYAPPSQGKEKENFFKDLNRHIKTNIDHPLILIGDFNLVEEPMKDRSQASLHYLESTEMSRRTFVEISSARGLLDIYRHLKPGGRDFTHFNKGCGIHSRLDRIYIPVKFSFMIPQIFSGLPLFSDHAPVGFNIQSRPNPKWGYGHKKMNPFYFADPNFQDNIKILIENEKIIRNDSAPNEFWNNLKRKFWIEYESFVKTYHQNRKRFLEALYKLPQTQERVDTIFEIQNIPNELKKATGLSYFKHVAEEDFLALYAKNKIKFDKEKCIKSILDGEIEVSEREEIINVIRNFYIDLYKSESPDEGEISNFLDMELPKISEEDHDRIKKFIKTSEIKNAIEVAAKGKTPGPDGIPVEFYKIFENELSPILTEAVNNMFLRSEFDRDFNHSITTLIYKGRGLRSDIKNWRPISLLNSDYKLLTKVIAERITPVLPGLIHVNQTCGVPGRTSFENIYNITSIIDQALDNNDKFLLITLDQEKAFDRIEHTYIRQVLRAFGFPDALIRWHEIISKNAKAKISINGLLTEPIDIERSVRQGDPLSMIIYILAIEPLACKIRENREIKGYKPINSKQIKLSQYADDSTPILTSVKSFFVTLNEFKKFGNVSGSKLNNGKTKIAIFGEWSSDEKRQIKKYIKPSVEILGICYGNDIYKENWSRKCAMIKDMVKKWESAHLALRSKIYIINTFILSNIWHVARGVPPNEDTCSFIQSQICRLLWGGTRESVPRTTAYLPTVRGGLGLPCVAAKIKAMILQKLTYALDKLDERPPWVGHLIYIEGFKLRAVDPRLAGNDFAKRLLGTTPTSLSPQIGVSLDGILADPGYDPNIWLQKKARPFYDIMINKVKSKIEIKYSDIKWNKIWKFVWNSGELKRYERQFLFLQLHEALPTAIKNAVSVPTLGGSEACRFCHKYLESNFHVFVKCPYLAQLRDEFFDFVRSRADLIDDLRGKTFLDVIILHNIHNLGPIGFKKVMIYGFAFKYAVWKCRCSMALGAPVPTIDYIINRINSLIRPVTAVEM